MYRGTVEHASPKRIDLAIGCNLAIKNANAELGIGFSAHPLIITGQFVKSLKEINSCEVEITFDPTWTSEMMSEEAKLELGML